MLLWLIQLFVVERYHREMSKLEWKDELGLTGWRPQSQHKDTASLPTGGFLLPLWSICSAGRGDYLKMRKGHLELDAAWSWCETEWMLQS